MLDIAECRWPRSARNQSPWSDRTWSQTGSRGRWEVWWESWEEWAPATEGRTHFVQLACRKQTLPTACHRVPSAAYEATMWWTPACQMSPQSRVQKKPKKQIKLQDYAWIQTETSFLGAMFQLGNPLAMLVWNPRYSQGQYSSGELTLPVKTEEIFGSRAKNELSLANLLALSISIKKIISPYHVLGTGIKLHTL